MSWGFTEPDRISLWRNEDNGTLTEVWSRGYVDKHFPPHMAYVADDGQHVVLRDIHSQLGYGKCLVFLGPDGAVLKAYALEDFLSRDEILMTPITVSSRWWSKPGWFQLRDDDRQFAFVTSRGTIRCFDTETGNRIKLDETLRAQIVAQAVSDLKDQLEDAPPERCAGAATLLGFLGAKECIPQLKKALTSSEVTALEVRNSSLWSLLSGKSETEPVYGVKLAAAAALVELMGAEALPLIEPEIRQSEGSNRSNLLRIASGDYFISFEPSTLGESSTAKAFWQRLAEDESEEIRAYALEQLARKEHGEFSASHPEGENLRPPATRPASPMPR